MDSDAAGWTWTRTNGIAFEIGQWDAGTLSEVVCYGYHRGVDANLTNAFLFSNLDIESCAHAFFLGNAAVNTRISNVYTYDVTQEGLYLKPTADNVQVSNCVFRSSNAAGGNVVVEGDNNMFSNVHVIGGKYSLYDTGDNNQYTGCRVDGGGATGSNVAVTLLNTDGGMFIGGRITGSTTLLNSAGSTNLWTNSTQMR
jgi:hypothetical protein